MAEYPMTFREFVSRFSTEEQCGDYLYQLRWKDGFKCNLYLAIDPPSHSTHAMKPKEKPYSRFCCFKTSYA
jgi:hypothetical protein